MVWYFINGFAYSLDTLGSQVRLKKQPQYCRRE
jgi:hypothetical protein